MIARRDPSPPRSGVAGSGRLRLLVPPAAAAAPARRLVAPGALPVESQRDGPAPAVLPLLRGESVTEPLTRREQQMPPTRGPRWQISRKASGTSETEKMTA